MIGFLFLFVCFLQAEAVFAKVLSLSTLFVLPRATRLWYHNFLRITLKIAHILAPALRFVEVRGKEARRQPLGFTLSVARMFHVIFCTISIALCLPLAYCSRILVRVLINVRTIHRVTNYQSSVHRAWKLVEVMQGTSRAKQSLF